MIIIRMEVCEVARVEAIECDRCKRQVRTEDENRSQEIIEFIALKQQSSVGTRLGDSLRVEGDLCQDCWFETLKLFARNHE